MFFQKLYGAQPNGAFMFLAFLSLDRLIDRIEETPFPLQNGNTRRSYSLSSFLDICFCLEGYADPTHHTTSSFFPLKHTKKLWEMRDLLILCSCNCLFAGSSRNWKDTNYPWTSQCRSPFCSCKNEDKVTTLLVYPFSVYRIVILFSRIENQHVYQIWD